MMYTIARYYSTSEHMSRLFNKLTNQMIRRCKDQITDPGKLWDQDKPTLLGNMRVGVGAGWRLVLGGIRAVGHAPPGCLCWLC